MYVPTRHRAIVGEIYERLGCPIEFGPDRPPSGHGTLAVKIDAGAALATVQAETIGADTVRLVRQARRELVERTHVEVVYVELPLADPATAIVAEELEQDGFGFLGVAPHFSPRGDLLRLAYLVDPLAREPIKTLDEPAGRLVDYALAEQTDCEMRCSRVESGLCRCRELRRNREADTMTTSRRKFLGMAAGTGATGARSSAYWDLAPKRMKPRRPSTRPPRGRCSILRVSMIR